MIYEFITPSDPITFLADNDKVAIACGITVGGGTAGVHDENGKSLPTMYFGHDNPMKQITKDLGMSLGEFIVANKDAICEALLSFAYCKRQDRQDYDTVLAAIKDERLRQEAKEMHENKNRSSMNTWVLFAWEYAFRIKNNIAIVI